MSLEINPYEKQSDAVREAFKSKCLSLDYSELENLPPPIAPSNSILYRHTTPFTVKVKSSDNSAYLEATLNIPDTKKTESFNIDRGFFVSRDSKLSFSNGILTKDETTYPSEILGFLSLPFALIDGISKAIMGRFTDRTTELANETAYINTLKARNEAKDSK
jgi:hypothetical protein